MDRIETRETIAALDKLIASGDLDNQDAETLKKLRRMVVGRDTAVEKIEAFRTELERACGLFFVASEAVHAADDYASSVDARIVWPLFYVCGISFRKRGQAAEGGAECQGEAVSDERERQPWHGDRQGRRPRSWATLHSGVQQGRN